MTLRGGRSAAAESQIPGRPLSTGGYVVLGLLLDEPATGWDLARKTDRSISHFWPLTRAHIYAELPKVAARGWATSADIPQAGAPDKRVYTATRAGRTAFQRWIADVDLTEERGRQPLQLQLFFAAHADPVKLTHLLDTWRDRARHTEQHCAGILTHRGIDVVALPRLGLHAGPAVDPQPDGARPGAERAAAPLSGLDARGMTALFGLRRAQADLAWLGEVRTILGTG